jgi:hypothetical protein
MGAGLDLGICNASVDSNANAYKLYIVRTKLACPCTVNSSSLP